MIGADRAYAQLELEHGAGTEPGDGVTVGVIDWGLDTGHPVFAGKTVTEEFLGSAQDDDHYASLGTDVASVIAGRPSETFTAEETAANGVAWAADIAFFAVRAGKFRSMYSPTSFANVAGAWPQWLRHVINWNSGGRTIDFVHLGIFYDGIIDQYDEQEIRSDFGAAIDALAQTGASEKTVFVLPGGDANGVPCDANEFEDNPELCVGGYVVASSVEVLPGLPALFPELLGHHVAVVAVGEDGNIAYFANRCGTAAPWCLAAPGANVRFAYAEPPDIRNTDVGDNSTYAAGMVTGGLALMKQFFRGQLSNTELVARLFATANKRGIYADSAVYGQGLLDLAAATSPVGNPRVARGERVDGAGTTAAETHFVPGGALGDGLTQGLAGQNIATFDALGAPFWFSLGDFTSDSPGPSAIARLRRFMATQPDGNTGARQPLFGGLTADVLSDGSDGLRLGFLAEPAMGVDGGHLSVAARALAVSASRPNGLGFSAFSTEGMRAGPAPASGAVLSWRPSESPLGMHGGVVAERETLLGSTASGAFGRLTTGSAFAGVDAGTRLGTWRLDAGAEIGAVNASVRDGMLTGLSPLLTSAFALRAERPLANGDSLRLSAAQPLRVESGRARLSVPTGRTTNGRVLRRPVAVDLAPTGREIEIAARWRRPLAIGGELRLGAAWIRQPGHAAAADSDLSVFAGWRSAF